MMSQDANLYFAAVSVIFFTMILIAYTIVKIWNEWIGFKRAELDSLQNEPLQSAPTTMSRIEVADLKERVRKLEAIAAGIDL